MRFTILHITLLCLAALINTACAQQLENNSFEDWIGEKELREPNGWNTIMTGDLCRFCSFIASQRVFEDSKEYIDGKRSIRIESKSILGGIIFNGSLTTGQIAVPRASASAGYNQTVRNNPEFNQKLDAVPDSLVFWAKYNVTDKSDSALVAFFIHGDTELKVPVSTSQKPFVVDSIRRTFQTNGNWKRIAISFDSHLDSNVNPEYVLATFSSSFAAGKGNGNAKLWVDDVQFIYNDESLTSSSISY